MTLIVIITIAMLFSGLALAYVVGSTTVLLFIFSGNIQYLGILPQKILSQLSVFALLSMPLFILTGEIMNRSGVTRALIDFSMSIVGRFRGGLGYVNILTSVFFAGISGSATADAAALTNTLVPAMEEQGYDKVYAAAITAASSIIGPIVPPSIILIFYGALMQTSVAALFVAGIIPGLLLAMALMILNGWFAWKYDHPRTPPGEMMPFSTALVKASPALCLPLIIVGGIVLGWMTATEAASVAVVVSLCAAFFYDGISLKSLMEGISRTAILTGSIFIILAAVTAMGFVGALERLPEMLSDTIKGIGLGPVGFLIALNVLFIISGMVMDILVALALLVPLLAPVAIAHGADPVHLGIMICFNLTIGLASPPLGGSILIVSTVSGVNYWRLARGIAPFVLVELLVLVVLVFVPEISLVLPRAFGL